MLPFCYHRYEQKLSAITAPSQTIVQHIHSLKQMTALSKYYTLSLILHAANVASVVISPGSGHLNRTELCCIAEGHILKQIRTTCGLLWFNVSFYANQAQLAI